MNLDQRVAAVHLGDGTVLRWPGAIVCVPPGDGARAAVEQLSADLAIGGDDPGPGRILEAIRTLTEAHRPSLAALVAVDAGVRALVTGNAEIAGADDPLVGTTGEITETDLGDPAGPLVLRGIGDGSGPVSTAHDLRAGTVPGRGVTVSRRVEHVDEPLPAPVPELAAPPAPPPPPVAAATEAGEETLVPGAFEVLDLGLGVDDELAPLPVIEAPDATGGVVEAAPDDGAELVPGILCSRGHFNNPQARYCMVCGISMVHLTHRVVHQPRPTLGFAVFDDGATYAFDRAYVVGRDPEDEATDRGAEALLLDDTERTVSRAHAEIRPVEWDVVLVDLGSTNGTFVWNPPAGRWDRLEPGEQRRLESGAAVSIGRRTFVFESVHRLAPPSGPTSTPAPPPELR
ncbi:MAG: FHA domain-containing protein [Actinomycetota bacterium]